MTTWRQQAVEGGSSDQEKRNFKKYSRLMSTAIRKLGEHRCITQSERGEGGGQPNAYVGETKGSCLRNDSMEKKCCIIWMVISFQQYFYEKN